MESDGQKTNNTQRRSSRFPNSVFRLPDRLERPPATDNEPGSRIIRKRSSESPHREHWADGGRRAAARRGVRIDANAGDPTLACEPADDRRRFDRIRSDRSEKRRKFAESPVRGDRHSRRSPASTAGGEGREFRGNSLRRGCSQWQPHPRLLRPRSIGRRRPGDLDLRCPD